MSKWNVEVPAGGRYTRPRRGFRAKSHYRDRLRKRGVSKKDVRMESLSELRSKQANLSGFADSFDSKGRTHASVPRASSRIQMRERVQSLASHNKKSSRKKGKSLEQPQHRIRESVL